VLPSRPPRPAVLIAEPPAGVLFDAARASLDPLPGQKIK
jgi:hypothetical protein